MVAARQAAQVEEMNDFRVSVTIVTTGNERVPCVLQLQSEFDRDEKLHVTYLSFATRPNNSAACGCGALLPNIPLALYWYRIGNRSQAVQPVSFAMKPIPVLNDCQDSGSSLYTVPDGDVLVFQGSGLSFFSNSTRTSRSSATPVVSSTGTWDCRCRCSWLSTLRTPPTSSPAS